MEQTAQETLTAQMPVQSNGGITSHEEVTGHNKGTRQEGSDSTQILSAHEAGQRARVATATFGEIRAMLSFSPVFKHLSLGDLKWLVIPALAINQVTVVRGKLKDQNGLLVPMGLALWAHVSEDVDKRLEAQQQANMAFHLAPQDWKSGEIPWLFAVLAPKEVAQALVNKLEATVFKDKTYKQFAFGQMEGTLQTSMKQGEEKI